MTLLGLPSTTGTSPPASSPAAEEGEGPEEAGPGEEEEEEDPEAPARRSQIAQFLALVVASIDTQRWVCAASVRSEGCSSADRLGHAVVAGSGPIAEIALGHAPTPP